jgi:hypothetical protein
MFALGGGGSAIAADPVALSTNPFGSAYDGASAPAVAVNARLGQRLVVWAGKEEKALRIHGRIIDEAGLPLGPIIAISDPVTDGDEVRGPAVAYNARTDEFLVTWVHREISAPKRRTSQVRAQCLTSAGVEVGANDFAIAPPERDWARDRAASAPAVAWNQRSNRYLVVWLGSVYGKRGAHPLFLTGRAVRADGSLVSPEVRRIFNRPARYPSKPALTYIAAMNTYLVAWNAARGLLRLSRRPVFLWSGRLDSRGRRRGRESAIARVVSRSPGLETSPSLSTVERLKGALLLWSGYEQRDTSSSIFDQFLDSRGKRTGPRRRISARVAVDEATLGAPVVAYNTATDRHIATWRQFPNSGGGAGQCDSGDNSAATQDLSGAGEEMDNDEGVLTLDMPGVTPGAGPGDCRTQYVGSIALAPGPGPGFLAVWSGAVAGLRQQVWTQPLSS